MLWEHPLGLLLLALLPLAGVLVAWARRRQRQAALEFAEPAAHRRLFPDISTRRGAMKTTLFLIGLALLLVGLAGPRWGIVREQVQSRGVDVFVLLDVSRSMLATDVTPSRLERAKTDVRDLLQELSGDRVGLIVFAGAAVVQVPLTTDQQFFVTMLDDVDPRSAPRGGTQIGDAIRKALESFDPNVDRDQAIILITDGEDHDSMPVEAAQAAAERGVKIFALGLGDAGTGARIPVEDPEGGAEFLEQDGEVVWSKMDERLLEEMSRITRGAYIPARTRAYDLGVIYRDHLAGLTRGELTSEERRRYALRFQIFALGGFVLILTESLISRFPREASSDENGSDRNLSV